MTGPKIRSDADKNVASDEEELLQFAIEPSQYELVRRLIGAYFRSSSKRKALHVSPDIYRGTIRALEIVLNAPEHKMFKAELQTTLESQLHLSVGVMRLVMKQVEHTLDAVNRKVGNSTAASA